MTQKKRLHGRLVLLIGYLLLFIAIVAEVIGSNLVKSTEEFTKLIPSLFCIGMFIIAIFMLSKTVRYIPLPIAYAIWGALGIVLVTLVGVFYWKMTINIPTIIGLGCIIIGVILVNLFGTGH